MNTNLPSGLVAVGWMDVRLPGASAFCAGPSYCELQAQHQSSTPGTTHACGSCDELTVDGETCVGQLMVCPDGRVTIGVSRKGFKHAPGGAGREIGGDKDVVAADGVGPGVVTGAAAANAATARRIGGTWSSVLFFMGSSVSMCDFIFLWR